MRKTKAANKLNVTFDYEIELFVPVDDGEFVLISTGNEDVQTIVLPRAARFTSRRDFYELYQDYYHCAKPDAGEVHIIQPAAVIPTVAGWKLLSTGLLEVLEDQSKKKASAESPRHQVEATGRAESGLSIEAMKEESAVTSCTYCCSLVETKYAFCWKCGNRLADDKSLVKEGQKPKATMSTTALELKDEEDTLHDLRPVRSPVFAWALEDERERAGSGNGRLLKLIVVAVVGLMLASLALFVLTRSASRLAGETVPQPVTANGNSNSIVAPAREVKRDVAAESTSRRTSGARPEDDELKALHESRIAASSAERSTILQAFRKAESKYPNDYRFPYERAKLAIQSQSSSHDEAFSALSLAVEKAIRTGKADQMLDDLEADKAGDFHKLSHGHHEWNRLTEALKGKGTITLSAKVKF